MIRRGIGVQSFVSAGGGTDADAQAFITAAGITDATQQSAITTLVTDLKGFGIWSKMKAIYPFVGGTSSTHKWNLKDPRDLDAAFRLVFSGGWTHSSTGALPNGTNGYADSKLNPNSILTIDSGHLSIYSRTQNPAILDQPARSFDGTNDMQISPNINAFGFNFRATIGGSNAAAGSNTDCRGLFMSSRTASNSLKGYINGSVYATNTSSGTNTMPNQNLYFGSANASGSAANYSILQLAFASIGDGLTDTEAPNLYTAVQKYQTTLGRSIGTQTVSDSDAQAFVNAAVIEDQVQATAINTLVTDLKGYGIWSKMKAIYPFVGGTSSTHKWNLKDPRDLDAAFRLVFSGGITHSNTGVLFNGTNGFGDTKFAPGNQSLTYTNNHISFYSRTTASGGASGFYDIGAGNDIFGVGNFAMWSRRSANTAAYDVGDPSTNRISFSNTDGSGFYLGKADSTTGKFYKNGVQQTTKTLSNLSLTTRNLYFGGYNENGTALYFTLREFAFASIGDGLTDTEAANLYTAVQAFQTTLGRQV